MSIGGAIHLGTVSVENDTLVPVYNEVTEKEAKQNSTISYKTTVEKISAISLFFNYFSVKPHSYIYELAKRSGEYHTAPSTN